MIIVLCGPPGAGKGTQAAMLHSKCGMHHFSTGEALRKHVRNGTDIGKKAGAIMERGELVPDDVLLEIVKAELAEGDMSKPFLLDGYPRNLKQAEDLAQLASTYPVKAAVALDVPRDELITRLSGRRVCSKCGATYHAVANPPSQEGVCDKCGGEVVQRADDSADAVATRLDVYEKTTKPVLDHYQQQSRLEHVAGTGSQNEIFERLRGVIESL